MEKIKKSKVQSPKSEDRNVNVGNRPACFVNKTTVGAGLCACPNKRGRPGQVAIELTAAFMVVFMLLVASARLFVWFCDSLGARASHFESTRNIAGSGPVRMSDVQPFNPNIPELKIVETAE